MGWVYMGGFCSRLWLAVKRNFCHCAELLDAIRYAKCESTFLTPNTYYLTPTS